MRQRLYIIISAVMLLILASCKKDDLGQIIPPKEYEKVNVKLNFRIPSANVPTGKAETRSVATAEGWMVSFDDYQGQVHTRSDGTTALHNLWVMQFDASGNKVASQKISTVSAAINDMAIIDANLVTGSNQSIYIVVLGKLFDMDLGTVSTISELEAMKLDYLQAGSGTYESKITSDEQIPYAGRVDGVEIFQLENGGEGYVKYNQPAGFDGGVEIRRLAAKISFTYTYNVTGFTLSSLSLTGVSNDMTIKSGAASNPSYVTLKGTKGVANGDGSYTSIWYVAANMKGEVNTIGTESDRNSNNAPRNATMIQISAQDNTRPNDFLMYEVYVGNNNTFNFDVAGNTIYSLNTLINASATAAVLDGRVTHMSVVPDIQLYASAKSGSGSSSPAGALYDIDSHYDFRPLSIYIAGANVKVEVLDATSGSLMDKNASWIKLSSSENYTKAVQQRDFDVQATASLAGPGNLEFYLYCDEYVDLTATEKRSVKVRVTSTSMSGGADKVDEFTLTQRPAIYLGRLGGTMGNDGYSAGLVVDQLDESNVKYMPNIQGTTSASIPWGYSNRTTNYANDREYGRESTRLLAENPNGIMVEDGLSIERHKPITASNGNLYQYNYYNTYAARFCYDRNRDENGNGVIDLNELKWYLPSENQLQGAWVLSENSTKLFVVANYWSSTETNATVSWCVVFSGGSTSTDTKINTSRVRCVRDVTP